MKKAVKRVLSIILAVVVIASCAYVGMVPASAATYRSGAQSGPSSSYASGKYYGNYLRVPITGDQRTDLIAIALSQLGYQEGASNGAFSGEVSGGANYVEYSYNMGDLGLGYGGSDYPWCASFVSWCLYQSHCTNHATYSSLCRNHSGDYNYIWKEISCAMWVNQLKGAGYFSYSAGMGGSYTPKYGDLVFFKSSSSPSHIGICLYVKDGVLYTVEGNTSDASGLETNGGGVYFKKYSLNSSYLYGYGRLPYKSDSSVNKVDYSGENPTPGLYVANAAKYIYASEYATDYSYVIPRFSMFEITKVGANNRLYGTFTNTAGQTCTGWITNNSDRIIQLYSSGALSGAWEYDGVGYKYRYSDGTYASKGWLQDPDNSAWYYIGADGYADSGWLYLDSGTFYLDPNSNAMLTGHRFIDGRWHYFNNDGFLCIGSWESDGVGFKYRFIDGTYGANCWLDDATNNYIRYYLGADGYAVSGWRQIDGTWYYFDPGSRAMLSGWLYIDNKWYYTDSSGAMQTGWTELEGNYYYLDPVTGARVSGVQTINGTTCTFDENGVLIEGTIIEDTTTPTLGNGYASYTQGMPGNGAGAVYAHGIDISKWNNGDDWTTLKLNLGAVKAAGIDFVIIRCGSTNKGKDPMFEMYYNECKRLGLDVGAYFYSYALDAASAVSDARKCLSYIEGKQFEYPIYMDFEDPTQEGIGSTLSAQICTAFLDTVASGGYLTGMYTYKSWFEQGWVDSSGIRNKYEGWVTYPITSMDHSKYDVAFSQSYGMYQYTFKYEIPNAGTFDANVCYKDYPSIVKTYGFNNYSPNSAGNLSASWVQDEKGLRYQYADGTFAPAGWLFDNTNNAWYYLDRDGYAVSGWVEDKGKTYYLDPTSNAMLTGHRYIDGKWYYFDSSGAWVNTGAWEYDGKGYKYKMSDGTYVYGWFDDYTNDSARYYMNSAGYAVSGFNTIDGTLYCFDAVSNALLRGWLTIGDRVYCTTAEGAILMGFQYIDGNYFYFSESTGEMQTGFKEIGDNWYYFDQSGVMTTGWFTSSRTGYIYHFNNEGEMTVGWAELDGDWYCFESDADKHYGQMLTGWIKSSSSGHTYYCDESGRMLTGWQEINGNTYYFHPTDENYKGRMLTGVHNIDGIAYAFADNGILAGVVQDGATEHFTVIYLDDEGTYLGYEKVAKGEAAQSIPFVPLVKENAQYTYTFAGWDADLENVTADIVAKAQYVASLNFYTVIFTDMNGLTLDEQEVEYGKSATAPEAPTVAGYEFDGWDTAFDNVTEDITVKAIYKKMSTPTEPSTTGAIKIEVSGGTGFTIAVDGGNARPQGATYLNSKAPKGAQVTVTANATDDATFIGWVNPISGVIVTTDRTHTFISSGNDFFKAMFAVKVEGVQMVVFKNDKANRILDSQYYAEGDTIEFPNAPTQVGFDFAGWNMTEAEIKSAIVSGQDVTVLANWTRQIVPVQVTVDGGTGTGSYDANSAVTVVANAAPAGQKFAYWTDTQGNIKSYSTEYKFYPVADTTLTAVFVPVNTAIDYQVLVSLDSIDTTSVADKNVFYYSWYCPEEYTFVKAGVVAVNKDNYNEATFVAGSSDSNVYDRSPSGTNLKPVNTFTWTKSNVTSGQTWMAKAYVQYRDAQGEVITVYSDVVKATKD